MLKEKQAIFDAFADKSAAADATNREESQIDDKTLGKLILEEIDRINAKNGNAGSAQASGVNVPAEEALPSDSTSEPVVMKPRPSESTVKQFLASSNAPGAARTTRIQSTETILFSVIFSLRCCSI